MKEIEILGSNRFETYTKTRIACRGIVISDGKILASREEKADCWIIPGGGLELDEALEECCVREPQHHIPTYNKTKENRNENDSCKKESHSNQKQLWLVMKALCRHLSFN